jgi:hypothetical protein
MLFIIPFGGILFSGFRFYFMERNSMFHTNLNYILWQSLSPLLIYLIFLVVSIILNTRQKFLENSIMSGTLISAYILFFALNMASSVVFNILNNGH